MVPARKPSPLVASRATPSGRGVPMSGNSLRGTSVVGLCALACVCACENTAKVSAAKAREHVDALATTMQSDVEEIRKGLPDGAKHLVKLHEAEAPPQNDLPAVRAALQRARDRVQDLRVAKSTFFALASTTGTVLRNDQEQDLMAGQGLFRAFPALEKAAAGQYVEALGSLPAARGVEGRDDAQWVAAAPVSAGGSVKGLYVTGWSWSAYAYRLENAVRTTVRPDSEDTRAKAPLVYALVVVDKAVYGAPITPDVNLRAVADLDPLSKVQGDAPFSTEIEITGRAFGLAVKAVPSVAPGVAVAVLRSET